MKDSQKILPTQLSGRIKSFLALSVLIGIVVFLYMQRGNLYAQMDEWKLIPRPERFTELYLKNHTELPKAITIGQSLTFVFSIHNFEGVRVAYPYIVFFERNSGERLTLQEDTVILDNGAEQIIEVTSRSDWLSSGGKVHVILKDQKQHIYFKLSNN